MNRIDNTHATFLNCLRDWNDPFLNGISNNNHQHHNHHAHKQFRLVGNHAPTNGTSNSSLLLNNPLALSGSCQRCETCRLCRSPNNTVLSDHNSSLSQKNSPRLVANHPKSFLHNSAQLTRCKSSANVPKTIEQSINRLNSNKFKTAKPIAKGNFSQIEKDKRMKRVIKNTSNSLNNTKLSINSIESDDKESVDTRTSKDDELDLSNNSSINKKSQLLNESNDQNESQKEKGDSEDLLVNESLDDYVLPLTESNIKTFDLVSNLTDLGNNNKQENDSDEFAKTPQITQDTYEILESASKYLSKNQSSSSSSSIQNDEIEYDDSLKEESFDSDR